MIAAAAVVFRDCQLAFLKCILLSDVVFKCLYCSNRGAVQFRAYFYMCWLNTVSIHFAHSRVSSTPWFPFRLEQHQLILSILLTLG